MIIMALPCFGVAWAESFFPYPMPPDSMQNFQPRCDYIVSRFWNRCNFDHAMTKPQRFNEAFGDWCRIMAHASADTVYAAVDGLLKRFEKKGGPETLALAQMAEGWLYSDTSSMHSEELMRPFAKAAAHHKKIGKDDKAHFAAIEKVLSASMVGATVPDMQLERPDGSRCHLGELCKGSVLLFFCTPGDPDCSISRIRFDTDPDTRALIDRGELTIISVFPGKPDAAWADDAKNYPANWHNVAMPDADAYFRLGKLPQMYFLNSERKVLAKNLDTDYLLGAFKVTNERRKK